LLVQQRRVHLIEVQPIPLRQNAQAVMAGLEKRKTVVVGKGMVLAPPPLVVRRKTRHLLDFLEAFLVKR
jgi:hypothetical protein